MEHRARGSKESPIITDSWALATRRAPAGFLSGRPLRTPVSSLSPPRRVRVPFAESSPSCPHACACQAPPSSVNLPVDKWLLKNPGNRNQGDRGDANWGWWEQMATRPVSLGEELCLPSGFPHCKENPRPCKLGKADAGLGVLLCPWNGEAKMSWVGRAVEEGTIAFAQCGI